MYSGEWDTEKQAVIYPSNNPRRTAYLKVAEQTIAEERSLLVSYLSRFENLGHTSEKTTLIYLGLLDNSLLDEANERVSAK